jgi:hypothetical protein
MQNMKWKSEISKIQKIYPFHDSFDLLNKLGELPSAIALYDQMIKGKTRPANMRKNIRALICDTKSCWISLVKLLRQKKCI